MTSASKFTQKDIGRRPGAIIYGHTVLSASMTFIKSHGEALQSFVPVYAGAHRASNGLELPEDRVVVVNDSTFAGKIKEYAFRTRGYAPRFVRQLRGHNPAIVHAHFGTSGPTGLFVARQLDVPLLVTFHGADATISEKVAASSRRGRELIKGKSELIEGAGRFIAVSGYIRDRLIEQDYPEDKIIVHRNGIDLDFFSPDESAVRGPSIVFVGRFVEKKGVVDLVRAAVQLKQAGIDFELVLVGDGPLRTSMETACSEAGINYLFTGFLTVQEVRAWLAKAAVVAVPSVTAADGDSEGLPTILLESQAMKTPVAATYHSGIPEGVIAGQTAELVKPGDYQALSAALQSFLESPQKVEEFGIAGRRFVGENFELGRQVSGLEDIYSELIASKRSGAQE